MKRSICVLLLLVLCCSLLAACGDKPSRSAGPALPDGVYLAEFTTDGSMFHVNEVYDGRGVLTVEDGRMTIHIVMPSKNIVNLFLGTAEDAQKPGAELLQPTVEEVTYPDGLTEEVNAFDIPVPYLDEEFDCALVGKKGTWYDHRVSVSNPVPQVADGSYSCEVTLSGGSGRASVESPARIIVKDQAITAVIVWSSSHYEYMTVDGTQYLPVNTEGNSTFEIPVQLDTDLEVSALTTAMSEPHLIEYTLHFDSSTLKAA